MKQASRSVTALLLERTNEETRPMLVSVDLFGSVVDQSDSIGSISSWTLICRSPLINERVRVLSIISSESHGSSYDESTDLGA